MAGIVEKLPPNIRVRLQLLGVDLNQDIGVEYVLINGVQYEAEPFTADEIVKWVEHFESYIAPVMKEIEYDPTTGMATRVRLKPMNITSAILREKARHIFLAGQIIKQSMGLSFDGYMAGSDKMGFRPIKPFDILRTTDATETPADTWSFSFAADEDYWIGYGTDNTTPATIDKYIGMVITGIANLSDNQVVEQVKFKVGNVEYPPVVLKPVLSMSDSPDRVPAMRIPTIILKPRDTVQATTYSSAAATNELVLIGVTYGKGSKLLPLSVSTVES